MNRIAKNVLFMLVVMYHRIPDYLLFQSLDTEQFIFPIKELSLLLNL